MDSLTQIVLGAAVGEVVLGKKVGNRALLWGAVGGTIPDLDVLSAFVVSDINELAYHRGFSHSIVFAVLGAYVFGWLVDKIYKSAYHQYIAMAGWFAIPLGIMLFFYRIFDVKSVSSIELLLILLIMGLLLYRNYIYKKRIPPVASCKEWQWLFFWSLFTHPVLDCFTTYGTQLFQPFSSYRVAFNAISVADPIYTVPFLLSVIALSFYNRTRSIRRILAWVGIGLSSAYLLFAVLNKSRINSIWQNSLKSKSIDYQRFMTSPTILNNVLWYCLAETDDGYYYGMYSILDKAKQVEMKYTPRNDQLLNAFPDDRTIGILKWFSNNYYNVIIDDNGDVQMNDLRYGAITNDQNKETYIFNFPLTKDENGHYQLKTNRQGPPTEDRKKMLSTLWTRIKGI